VTVTVTVGMVDPLKVSQMVGEVLGVGNCVTVTSATVAILPICDRTSPFCPSTALASVISPLAPRLPTYNADAARAPAEVACVTTLSAMKA